MSPLLYQAEAAAEALDFIPAGVTDVRLSVIYQSGDLKSGARGSVDEKALAPTMRLGQFGV